MTHLSTRSQWSFAAFLLTHCSFVSFRQAAEEVAVIDLKKPFRQWPDSTDELDYAEALDWFGVRFSEDPQPRKPGNSQCVAT